MKLVFVLLICVSASFVQAQTAIIAHKSHSGAAVDFFMDPNTNFGIPRPRQIQVIRVNDSTCVNVYLHHNGDIYHDTIYTKTNYNMNIDSVKKNGYQVGIEYVNFKRSSKNAKAKPPGRHKEQVNPVKSSDSQMEQKQQNTPKKKKKSYLLFLFGITGGGILFMQLFRAPKSQRSAA